MNYNWVILSHCLKHRFFKTRFDSPLVRELCWDFWAKECYLFRRLRYVTCRCFHVMWVCRVFVLN